MAASDNVDKTKALDEIKAFDLVTEGLLSLDAYQRRHDKSHLSEAKTVLWKALRHLNDDDPLRSRAHYFVAMAEYLDTGMGGNFPFDHLKPESDKINEWSAYDAERSYNAGAVSYLQGDYDTAAKRFLAARNAEAAEREVRLLGSAGAALSIAKVAMKLSSTDTKEAQQLVSAQVAIVNHFCQMVRRQLFFNFFRWIWGARHVERALTRKARSLIKQAREEISHISPPRPQTPPVVNTEPPTGQTGDLAGAT